MIATVLFIISVLILLFHPDVAQDSIYATCKLCIHSLIPSLFPFGVISNLWISSGYANKASRIIGKFVETFFHLPARISQALLIGCISGFPLGAHTILQLYNNHIISKEETEQALLFCSNAGPAFVVGFVGTYLFHNVFIGFLLWMIQLLAAFITGIAFRPPQISFEPEDHISDQHEHFLVCLTNSILQAGETIIRICVMVVFFSLFTAYVSCCLPPHWKCSKLFLLLLGSFELVGGITSLIGLPTSIALLFSSALLSWNGICVHCQVISSIHRPLSLKKYFLGKVMHILISTSITMLFSNVLVSTTEYIPNTKLYGCLLCIVILSLLITIFLFVKTSSGKRKTIRL